MERIQARQVSMRPRAYFMLKLASLAALSGLILVISILLSNLISFDLRLNGHDRLLGLGWRGIYIAIVSFPWWLLVIDVGLIVLLRSLLKAYSFGYKNAWLPLVGALLLISSAAGATLDHGTMLNDTLLQRADDDRLPSPINALYAEIRHLPHEENGEFRGRIMRVDDATLYLATHRESTTTPLIVKLPTKGPDVDKVFEVGQTVVVLGELEEDGIVYAFGIRPIDESSIPPRPEGQH